MKTFIRSILDKIKFRPDFTFGDPSCLTMHFPIAISLALLMNVMAKTIGVTIETNLGVRIALLTVLACFLVVAFEYIAKYFYPEKIIGVGDIFWGCFAFIGIGILALI